MKAAASPVQQALRALVSAIVGVAVAGSLALRAARYQSYSPFDRLLLFTAPALTLTFLVYLLYPRLQRMTDGASLKARSITAVIAGLAAAFVAGAPGSQTSGALLAGFLAALAGFWSILAPAARSLDQVLASRAHARLLVAWLGACAAGAIVIAILANAHQSTLLLGFLTVFAIFALTLLFHHAIGRLEGSSAGPVERGVMGGVFALVVLGVVAALWVAAQSPEVYPDHRLLPDRSSILRLAPLALITLPWLAFAVEGGRTGRAAPGLWNRAWQALDENLPGFLLAGGFFLLYLVVGLFLNQARFDVDDIFFDADGFIWRYRLTTEHWQDFYWRSVHPLALPLLRPPALTLSALLRGDAALSVTVLAAAGGAASVLLAWLFVRRAGGTSAAALVSAALLGASASHLVFGSMIETYIFLAAGALLFLVLLQRADVSLHHLVPAGLVTTGLTITSLGQGVLALAVLRPQLRLVTRYVVLVLALLVPLSLIGDLVYPRAVPLFFLPSGYAAEQENIWAGSPRRGLAMVRSMALYSMVAPEPVVTEGEIPFPQFRFYRAESGKLAEYESPLQVVTAWSWLILLATAGVSVLANRSSVSSRFLFALLLCIAFNAALHVRYGKELFLYSANCTYALVLAAVLAWGRLLNKGWFQAALLLFLGLLLLNNLGLVRTLILVTSPYFQ